MALLAWAPLQAEAAILEFTVNIHSSVFPNGEIRGQIISVPGPAGLLFGGVAVVGLFIRRRFR